MKIILLITAAVFTATSSLLGADSAAEKAFLEKFKTAFETNDKATLESFLYKEGAHPRALEFYRMMLVDRAGGKIAKIELVDLTPEELQKLEGTDKGPDGEEVRMPLNPKRKLVITPEASSGSGSGSMRSSPLVAEKDGKFVIPVPAPAK